MKLLGNFSYTQQTRSQGLTCLEFLIMSIAKTECTNPDLGTNNAIDVITIFNCGFKFQNATHVDAVKQLDNLVQQ